jgi:uncharacterized protein YceH (UPF0502 family)
MSDLEQRVQDLEAEVARLRDSLASVAGRILSELGDGEG